jgi:Xaa-Pro aminopeptidase
MGVRIEDNVCVTERGIENLNEELTTDPEEVKQWLE